MACSIPSMIDRMTRIVLSVVVGSLVCNAHAGPFDSITGNWRGQTEYRATINAVEDDAAHAVVDLFLRVEVGGKVTGRALTTAASFWDWRNSFRPRTR